MKSLVGTLVAGKYRLDRVLGKGGMGVVYEATNESVGRRVALKRVWSGGADDADLVGRLQREARATASIQSPYVVEILDVVRDEHDELWVVMELLEGESLASRIQRFGALGVEETAAFVRQALLGLEAAHEQHIVHRDLKPANLFLHRTPDGEPVVKLLDFGISKWMGDASSAGRMTATGAMLGTPSYMAPEQARASRDADERSDVYSAGAILYDCLTGEPPYGRDTYPVVLGRLMTQDPVDVADLAPHVPPALVDVVRRAMARDPADRFPSAAAMRAALEASVDLTSPRPLPSTRRRPPAPKTELLPAEPAATPYAGESVRVPRARAPFALVGAGVGVGIVGAILFVALSGNEPATPPVTPPMTATPLQLPPLPAAQPPAPPALPPAPPPAPPPPVAPVARRLQVAVAPASARPRVTVALRSGVELSSGENPAVFELPSADEALRVIVRADGYREATRELEDGDDEIAVRLERRAAPRRNHGPTIDDRNPLRH